MLHGLNNFEDILGTYQITQIKKNFTKTISVATYIARSFHDTVCPCNKITMSPLIDGLSLRGRERRPCFPTSLPRIRLYLCWIVYTVAVVVLQKLAINANAGNCKARK